VVAEEPLLSEVADGVALITLNRPGSMNAWTPRMEELWFAALDTALLDPAVRAVVVTGAGRGFCAGLDSGHLAARSSGAEAAPTRTRGLSSLATYPKPVIGAVNGPAVGLGLALALCCDIRFASTEARFVTMFARLGLSAEFGAPWLLPRIVGHSVAMDLLLSARPVGAEEALALRLVDRVLPPQELLPAALDYAKGLARRSSPLSMAAIKSMVLADEARPLDESEAESSKRNRSPRGRQEFREGAAAARDRRTPSFDPLAPDHRDARSWLSGGIGTWQTTSS
jgi:enoyl-CoA hydratase/carnithine racemase